MALVALSMSACGYEVVNEGYRGIKTNLGEIQGEPLLPGLHTYNPFTADIFEYAVREDKFEASTTAFTKDTQKAQIGFTVTWSPDPKRVGWLYKEIGSTADVEQKIIQPVVLGSLKDAVGQIIADDLVAKRDVATKSALMTMKEALKERSIFVTDLQFTNIDFDPEYEKAVEAKVVALQLAQKAKNETVRIKEEAEQKVATATAEAKAMQIKTQALSQNKGLVAYELAQKWDGVLPKIIMGDGAIPMIDMKEMTK